MFFKVIGRLTAGFFRGLSKLVYTSFRKAGRRPISALLITTLVVGVIVLLYSTDAFGLTNGTFLKSNNTSAVITPLERKNEPDSKSTEFLNALKDAKASVMFNLLSADYRSLLKQRGITDANVMQNLMNQKLEEVTKQKNGRLTYRFTYVIGTRYNDGSVDDHYSGTLEARSARANVEFVFKVNKGQIIDIQTTEPVTIAALGTNKADSQDAAQVGALTNNRSGTAESFMIGLTTFDADKIWESLADSYKEQLQTRNINRDSIAKLFTQIKTDNQSGKTNGSVINYDGYLYYQTINFPNGVSVNNFIAILSVQDNPREPGYNIVLDANNKIIRLGNDRAVDPIFSALLGRSQNGQ